VTLSSSSLDGFSIVVHLWIGRLETGTAGTLWGRDALVHPGESRSSCAWRSES
jgi:hypothetical protein